MSSLSNQLINQNQYQHSSISIYVNNEQFSGVKAINYAASNANAKLYGTSKIPVGRTAGKVSFTADMEMYKKEADEFFALINSLGGSSLFDTSFDIVITYQDTNNDVKTDNIIGCKILEWTNSSTESETPISVKIKLDPMNMQISGSPLIV